MISASVEFGKELLAGQALPALVALQRTAAGHPVFLGAFRRESSAKPMSFGSLAGNPRTLPAPPVLQCVSHPRRRENCEKENSRGRRGESGWTRRPLPRELGTGVRSEERRVGEER